MIVEMVRASMRALGIDPRAVYQRLSAASIKSAISEQNLAPLVERMRRVAPDLRAHFTASFDEIEYARYWEWKMRGQQAWQIRCALTALQHLAGDGLVLADIGDSSGHHGMFIKALAPPGKISRVVSVNLDPVAVEKVRAKGGDAILSRAEELNLSSIKPDLFMSFETVEHLTDPVRFLHGLATRGSSPYLLMTVPYCRTSRFGGGRLREPMDSWPRNLTAEDVHVYEFSADDWLLMARFAGWRPIFTDIYLQYPRRSPLRVMQPIWRRLDFEGFFAAFLTRDLTVAERYADW